MRGILFFLGILFLIITPTFASNIGTTIDKTYAEISKGQIGKFEIDVFSMRNSTLYISVSAGSVKDLKVDILPKSFELKGGLTENPTSGSKWIIVDGNKYAKLYPVYVYVRVPEEITQNDYTFPITISSYERYSNAGKGIKQNLVQALQYTLRIHVPGQIKRVEEFVNMSNNPNLLNYPAYQLPKISPTHIYNPPKTDNYENIGPVSQDENSINQNNKQKVPTGFFTLSKDKVLNWPLIILIFIIIILVIILLKK